MMNEDLISRQAAIDAVNYNCTSLKDIKRAINNLPSAQQWIPCSERLPQTGTNVLVSYKDNDEPIGVIYGARPYLWESNAYTPIAWMPLPEPYGEKNNE